MNEIAGFAINKKIRNLIEKIFVTSLLIIYYYFQTILVVCFPQWYQTKCTKQARTAKTHKTGKNGQKWAKTHKNFSMHEIAAKDIRAA